MEWDSDEPAPRILVRRSHVKRDRSPAPSVGARVLMRVDFDPDAGPKAPAYSGRVVKILDKMKARAFAVYRSAADGSGRAVPVDKKAAGREYVVPVGMKGDAQDGDLVAIEPLREGRLGLPPARVVETIGSVKSERAVSLIALETHHIPHVFSPAALKEAEDARPIRLSAPREDWRELPLVTIDPPDAKDHDDAVHAELDSDPKNPGGFIVTVAIADVAAYVQPGMAMDREALERGNSVYFPDRVVPMLPERISNDLCSLRPHEDRPALAVRMVLSADGRKRSHKFHRIMMRSAAKLIMSRPRRRSTVGLTRRRSRSSTPCSSRSTPPIRSSESSASGAIRSISICPSASLFSIPRGASRTCGGRSGSRRIG